MCVSVGEREAEKKWVYVKRTFIYYCYYWVLKQQIVTKMPKNSNNEKKREKERQTSCSKENGKQNPIKNQQHTNNKSQCDKFGWKIGITWALLWVKNTINLSDKKNSYTETNTHTHTHKTTTRKSLLYYTYMCINASFGFYLSVNDLAFISVWWPYLCDSIRLIFSS